MRFQEQTSKVLLELQDRGCEQSPIEPRARVAGEQPDRGGSAGALRTLGTLRKAWKRGGREPLIGLALGEMAVPPRLDRLRWFGQLATARQC